MLARGDTEPCRGRHVYHETPHFAVPKPGNPTKMQIVGDFQALSAAVEADSCRVTFIPELWLRTQQYDQTSVVNLDDGYYQVAISWWARPYFWFCVGNHYYRYTRLPQEYVNASAIFINCIEMMAPALIADPSLEVNMDDVVGYGPSPVECWSE
eukprot:GHVT01103517.1.p1 GENE.GHVT01103517.1~~GHVT01103517.1.p1  ORF type:complete len:154 (+),score=1.93 GHVT01103517.1:2133-2594(+)